MGPALLVAPGTLALNQQHCIPPCRSDWPRHDSGPGHAGGCDDPQGVGAREARAATA